MPSDTLKDWGGFFQRWSRLKPPLRPNAEIVARIAASAGGAQRRVLLLGVTPELALAFADVTAIDKTRSMIDHIWPGDTPQRRAIAGDWLHMDQSLGSFDAAVGDGSLSAVTSLDEIAEVLRRVAGRLPPGGPCVFRTYVRPDSLSEDDIARPATGAEPMNFHAFKWRIAMYLAGRHGAAIPLTLIHDFFVRRFPGREDLSRRTGWPLADIDGIDAYRDSATAYCFPSRQELLAALPETLTGAGFHPSGSYDLAADCPLFVARRR